MCTKRGLFSWLMAAVMLCLMIPFTSVTALAENNSVSYKAPIFETDTSSGAFAETYLKGFETKSCNNYTLAKSNQWGLSGQETWYVASGNVTITGGVTVSGNVQLILEDGCILTVNSGIYVPEDSSLTVYGQLVGNGQLIATGDDKYAGIGGRYDILQNISSNGPITINGGDITATGNYGGAGIGGGYYGDGKDITINGGQVVATGNNFGSGIGGGGGGKGYSIVINGGTVVAESKGCGMGAGIGGGASGEAKWITINGGLVTATSAGMGAGIGSGSEASASDIVIKGGTVTAIGRCGGACIGGGYKGNGHSISIYGGKVTAKNNVDKTGWFYDGGAGIGGGYMGSGYDISIYGGDITAIGTYGAAGIGSGIYAQAYNISIMGGTIKAEAKNEHDTAIGNGKNCATAATGIKVSAGLQIVNDNTEEVIAHDDSDIASVLSGVKKLSITLKQEPAPSEQASSVLSSGSLAILIGGCVLLIIAAGVVISKRKKKA